MHPARVYFGLMLWLGTHPWTCAMVSKNEISIKTASKEFGKGLQWFRAIHRKGIDVGMRREGRRVFYDRKKIKAYLDSLPKVLKKDKAKLPAAVIQPKRLFDCLYYPGCLEKSAIENSSLSCCGCCKYSSVGGIIY